MTIVLTMIDGPGTCHRWDGQEQVEVPHTILIFQVLTPDDSVELLLKVNPLDHSDFHGVYLYLETVIFFLEKCSNRTSSRFLTFLYDETVFEE